MPDSAEKVDTLPSPRSTPTRDESERLVERYLEAHGATQLETVVALFSDEAILEDPVGTPPIRGRAAIRDFYAATHARNGRLRFERVGPILLGGNELALHVRARLERSLAAPAFDVIYAIEIDAVGQIQRLRAFF